MSIAARIHEVFGHFQNLNLLVLMQDLCAGQIARQSWSTGSSLCPIAHGLPAGRDVRRLVVMGQEADLRRGCAFAAGVLGVDGEAVYRFVRGWDEQGMDGALLLRDLEELWQERLADALAMQEVLEPTPMVDDVAVIGQATRACGSLVC
jgi:hypothetical protein